MLDISKIHIDDVLKDISETVLIELPEDHVYSVQHLIESNKVSTPFPFNYTLSGYSLYLNTINLYMPM